MLIDFTLSGNFSTAFDLMLPKSIKAHVSKDIGNANRRPSGCQGNANVAPAWFFTVSW
jgi:hypothetical protein